MPTSLGFWRIRAGKEAPSESPGMPCADDLRPFTNYLERLRRAQAASGKAGLVLGATRQTVDWCRDNGLRVTVMDFCESATLGLESSYKDRDGLEIVIDNWLTTAHPDHSFCWAAGDGAINAVGCGRNAIHLFRQVCRLLLPGSIVVLRDMLRPLPTPAAADVFAKLAKGQIRNFSAFRHRVAQSLQPSFMDGISTRTVYKVLLESGILDGNPRERFGRPAEQLRRMDYWELEDASLCYPTLEEVRDLTDSGFEELDICYGGYEMGDLSPTIVYQTRPRGRKRVRLPG
jgi:hypothetical protein